MDKIGGSYMTYYNRLVVECKNIVKYYTNKADTSVDIIFFSKYSAKKNQNQNMLYKYELSCQNTF